jgi:hypothetical protein
MARPTATIKGTIARAPEVKEFASGKQMTKIFVEVEIGKEKTQVLPITFFRGAKAVAEIPIGTYVLVEANPSGREYNGNTYTDIQCDSGEVWTLAIGNISTFAHQENVARHNANDDMPDFPPPTNKNAGLSLDLGGQDDDQVPF